MLRAIHGPGRHSFMLARILLCYRQYSVCSLYATSVGHSALLHLFITPIMWGRRHFRIAISACCNM